jgi:hypothetical protein
MFLMGDSAGLLGVLGLLFLVADLGNCNSKLPFAVCIQSQNQIDYQQNTRKLKCNQTSCAPEEECGIVPMKRPGGAGSSAGA